MTNTLGQLALVVRDYDEAIDFYTRVLDFELLEDTPLSETKRWVRVRPRGGATGAGLLLARAANDEQRQAIGNQCGGRVFLFLYTDDFTTYYQRLLDHEVTIIRPPEDHPYGRVAVFADCYGNLWDLIQPRPPRS